MTCKNCIHYSYCDSLAVHDFDYHHKMWLMEFWGNAHERCTKFEPAGKKYRFTVELVTDDIIGAKEQIAMALEKIGKVTFPNVEEIEDG